MSKVKLFYLNAKQQSIKHYEGEFYTDGYTDLATLAHLERKAVAHIRNRFSIQ